MNPYADYTVAQMDAFLNRYSLTRDIGAQYGIRTLVLAYSGMFWPAVPARATKPLCKSEF